MTVNYGRLFIAVLCAALMLPALYIQGALLALSTEGGPLPAGGVLGLGAMFSAAFALVGFLLGLFGGLRYGLGTAGWILVPHLLGYGWLIAALAPTPVDAWAASALNPYPVPVGVSLIVLAIGLAVALIRSARRAPKARRRITPLA